MDGNLPLNFSFSWRVVNGGGQAHNYVNGGGQAHNYVNGGGQAHNYVNGGVKLTIIRFSGAASAVRVSPASLHLGLIFLF